METTTCQNCKRNCTLQIDGSSYIIKVKGNRCARGINYAENYIYNQPTKTKRPLSIKTQIIRGAVGLLIVTIITLIILIKY